MFLVVVFVPVIETLAETDITEDGTKAREEYRGCLLEMAGCEHVTSQQLWLAAQGQSMQLPFQEEPLTVYSVREGRVSVLGGCGPW